MAVENIFNRAPFHLQSVTAAVQAFPKAQTIINSLKLFKRSTSAHTTVRIEYRDGMLGLLNTKPRGSGQGEVNPLPSRRVRAFNIPHIPKRFTVTSDELPDIRSWNSNSAITAAEIIADHLEIARAEMDATIEYHRIGALKGIIKDPNGDEILDLWDEFGIVQEEFAIDFASSLSIRQTVREAQRYISTQLGAIQTRQFIALCGADFYDAMIDSDQMAGTEGIQIPDARLGGQLRETYYQTSVGLYDVLWIPFEAQVAGVQFLDPEEALLFPRDIPGLFRDIVGPCDTFAKRVQDFCVDRRIENDFNTTLEYRVQTNRLQLVTQPKLITKLTMESSS